MDFEVEIEGKKLSVGGGKVESRLVRVERPHPCIAEVRIDGKTLRVYDLGGEGETRRVRVNGKTLELRIKTPEARALELIGKTGGSGFRAKELRAPMPGLVKAVFVEPGQTVEGGAPLIALEAMKMENLLKAPGALKIKNV
ncbi:MAG: biotin/lipoyl-containing protein, partial [Bacteroidia bacterium]|nr:hypothetical protein [Bacteroidia bacterium]MDW8333879.1 biotin/lipoyl-containing protein [Bacteroidia bacterium]